MAKPAYRRVIVKVSGEAFSGPERLRHSRADHRGASSPIMVKAARALGITIGVVVGGGNLIRGAEAADAWLARPTADAMGMMGTVMNALVLEAAIERAGVPTRARCRRSRCRRCARPMSASARCATWKTTASWCSPAAPAIRSSPPTPPAVLRAAEMDCDAVLKATNVDGVYSADPKKDPKAKRYDRLTHEEAIRRDLKVMDATAFALARENRMPIIVFSIREPGAIAAVLDGKGRATFVG